MSSALIVQSSAGRPPCLSLIATPTMSGRSLWIGSSTTRRWYTWEFRAWESCQAEATTSIPCSISAMRVRVHSSRASRQPRFNQPCPSARAQLLQLGSSFSSAVPLGKRRIRPTIPANGDRWVESAHEAQLAHSRFPPLRHLGAEVLLPGGGQQLAPILLEVDANEHVA